MRFVGLGLVFGVALLVGAMVIERGRSERQATESVGRPAKAIRLEVVDRLEGGLPASHGGGLRGLAACDDRLFGIEWQDVVVYSLPDLALIERQPVRGELFEIRCERDQVIVRTGTQEVLLTWHEERGLKEGRRRDLPETQWAHEVTTPEPMRHRGWEIAVRGTTLELRSVAGPSTDPALATNPGSIGDVDGLSVDGEMAVSLDGSGRIGFVHVRSDASLEVMANLPMAGVRDHLGPYADLDPRVDVLGRLAVVAHPRTGVQLFDLRDPRHPIAYPPYQEAGARPESAVLLEGQRAAVWFLRPDGRAWLSLLDLSDPARISRLARRGGLRGTAILERSEDRILALSGQSRSLRIGSWFGGSILASFEIDADRLRMRRLLHLPGPPTGLEASGQRILAATHDDRAGHRITFINHPSPRRAHPLLHYDRDQPIGLALSDDRAWISSSHRLEQFHWPLESIPTLTGQTPSSPGHLHTLLTPTRLLISPPQAPLAAYLVLPTTTEPAP